jgi:hypothetical protein
MCEKATWIALAVAAAFLISCGGGGGNTGNTTNGVSRAKFNKEANQICEEGIEEKEQALASAAKANPATPEDPYSKEEIESLVVDAALPELKRMTEDLAALDAPEGDEAAVEKIVRMFEAGVEKTGRTPIEFIEGNPFLPADRAAQAYGLESCSV